MNKFLIKILIWIHNLSYRLIGILVIKENNGLHPKHKILNYYQFFLDNISPTDGVLDIGCGNGACAKAISEKAARVTGIEISPKKIRVARKRFAGKNIKYIAGDATTYEFKESFNVIILSNVLEHISDRINFLIKIKNLAPKILIRVPLLSRDWLAVYKKNKGYEYRLDRNHFVEYTEESFGQEIKKAELVIESFFVKFGELYSVITHK